MAGERAASPRAASTRAARGAAGGAHVPLPRVVVELAGKAPAGRPYRIEAPDRVMRMWFLLNAVAEVAGPATLPPEALARDQRLLHAVAGEIERSVSPALAEEMHHFLSHGGTAAGGAGEVAGGAARAPGAGAAAQRGQTRIDYASLLGWLGGLVISMLGQLESARKADLTRRGRLPGPRTAPP